MKDTPFNFGARQDYCLWCVEIGVKRRRKQEKEYFEFPRCCEGIAKLKDFQLKIPIDPEVQPVAQPIRRVPYHVRDKLTKKLL